MRRFLVGAVVVGALAVAGCSSSDGLRSSMDSVAAAALKVPMTVVAQQQAEMLRRLEAGDVGGARRSYVMLADALSQVQGPLSKQEPALVREMATASETMTELLDQKPPDRAQVARQAQVLMGALRRAADGVGISLGGSGADTGGAVAVTAKAAPAVPPKQQTIEVRARDYRFTPAVITVDKGTRVTIKLINDGTEKHEFELDAFKFEINPIAPNTSAQKSFVADRTGRFEFACHVDGHFEKGMKGTLVVK